MDYNLLREWVKAEIDAAIADNEEDEEGYRGCGYAGRRFAEAAFQRFVNSIPIEG